MAALPAIATALPALLPALTAALPSALAPEPLPAEPLPAEPLPAPASVPPASSALPMLSLPSDLLQEAAAISAPKITHLRSISISITSEKTASDDSGYESSLA